MRGTANQGLSFPAVSIRSTTTTRTSQTLVWVGPVLMSPLTDWKKSVGVVAQQVVVGVQILFFGRASYLAIGYRTSGVGRPVFTIGTAGKYDDATQGRPLGRRVHFFGQLVESGQARVADCVRRCRAARDRSA